MEKNFIYKFKHKIQFIVSIFASREFAFIYCVCGVIGQISHTYYLTESISSFTGNFRTFQAVILSAFISSSLLYFVAVIDENDEDKKSLARNKKAINIFTVIEIIINIFYYSKSYLILENKETGNITFHDQSHIYNFVFGILISCLIPITIKLYASNIKAKEWILLLEKNNFKENVNDIDMLMKNEIDRLKNDIIKLQKSFNNINIDEKIKLNINEEIKTNIDEQIKNLNIEEKIYSIFDKNQLSLIKQIKNILKQNNIDKQINKDE